MSSASLSFIRSFIHSFARSFPPSFAYCDAKLLELLYFIFSVAKASQRTLLISKLIFRPEPPLNVSIAASFRESEVEGGDHPKCKCTVDLPRQRALPRPPLPHLALATPSHPLAPASSWLWWEWEGARQGRAGQGRAGPQGRAAGQTSHLISH